jgi:two-component system sensor histidine kinase PilS (NtrC family)
MRGAIQVLESTTPKTTTSAGLMDIILKESDRLNNIIVNFLSYARPSAAEFIEVDLRETLQDALTLLKHSPDVREDHIIEADLKHVKVVGDPTQLKQIFWNLCRNALQAMPDGGKLSVKLHAMPNSRARITFEDTGRGMSREQVEKLFEPFSESTTGGTGLGLSIVYQIVKDHNGVINVKSRERGGTTITVDLPRDNRVSSTPGVSQNAAHTRLEDFLNVGTKPSS